MSTPDGKDAIISEPVSDSADSAAAAQPVLDTANTSAAVRAAVAENPTKSEGQITRQKLKENGASDAFLEMLEEMESSATGLGVRAENGTLWELGSIGNNASAFCRRVIRVEGSSLEGIVEENEIVQLDVRDSHFKKLESDGSDSVILMRKLANNPKLAGRLVATPHPRIGIEIAFRWKGQKLPMYCSRGVFYISGDDKFRDAGYFDPESANAEDIDRVLDDLENTARLESEEKKRQEEAEAAAERAEADKGKLPGPVPEKGTFEFAQYTLYMALMQNPNVKGRLALKDGTLFYEWEGKRFMVLINDENPRIFFNNEVAGGGERLFNFKFTRNFDPATVTAQEIDRAFARLFNTEEPVARMEPTVILDVPPPAAPAEMVNGQVDAIVDENPRLDAPEMAQAKSGLIAYGSDRGIGYKDENQDCLLIKTANGAFACVDGMGSYDGAAYAAQLLAEAFSAGFDKGQTMEEMQIAAHESMQGERLGEAGACYIAAKIVGNKLHIGQAGDVRLIVVRKKEVVFQTRDEGFGTSVTNAVTGLRPGHTTTHVFDLEVKDRVIAGTDGVWNNVSLEEAAQLPESLGEAIASLNNRVKEKMARLPEFTQQRIPARRDNASAIIHDIERLD